MDFTQEMDELPSYNFESLNGDEAKLVLGRITNEVSNKDNSFSLQVNDSSVFGGTNIVVSAKEKKKGGLLMRSIAGDLLRVWESKPQVQPSLAESLTFSII